MPPFFPPLTDLGVYFSETGQNISHIKMQHVEITYNGCLKYQKADLFTVYTRDIVMALQNK